MEPQFWLDRWSIGRTGFHSEEVHPDLLANEAHLAGDGPQRVLVPLCGMSVDLAWFASRGDEVVGIDLAPQAAEAVMGEAPTDELGPYRRQRRGGLTYLGLLGAVVVHGLWVAARTGTPERALLAGGCSLLLLAQWVVIFGGTTGLLPLTGVVVPFLS